MITTPKPGKPPAEMKVTMNNDDSNIDWSKTTWEDRRRVQLRQWYKLSLRERLGAVVGMAVLSVRRQSMYLRQGLPGK